VTGFVHATSVEKPQQRGFGIGEIVEPREPCAGLETVTDLGVVCASEELDDGRLAALRLSEQPEYRDGVVPAHLFQPRLEFRFMAALPPGPPVFHPLPHDAPNDSGPKVWTVRDRSILSMSELVQTQCRKERMGRIDQLGNDTRPQLDCCGRADDRQRIGVAAPSAGRTLPTSTAQPLLRNRAGFRRSDGESYPCGQQ